MAHEVRNPLTAIKMQLQLLEERVDEEDRDRIQKVLGEIRRLELIVESTLVLGGPLNLQLTPIEPAALVDEVVALLRPALEHRGISLVAKLGTLPTTAMDADRIKQVLLNLINNAADELSHGGVIRISGTASVDEDSLDIAIEDSGPGIDELRATEQSAKPFSLGVGLTISREIVDRHGGKLLIGKSTDLGGACFTIRLPVTIIAAQSA
jgi:signal transduction histidine kinase